MDNQSSIFCLHKIVDADICKDCGIVLDDPQSHAEMLMESVFRKAKITVQPILDRERENEFVPEEVMNFIVR